MAVTRLRFNAARISASRRDRSTIAPDHTMKKGKESFDFHDTSRRPPRPIQSALDTSPADQEFSSDRSTRARSIGLSDVDLARHRRGDEGCAGFLQAVDCIANMSHDHLGLPSVSVTDFDNRALFFERRQRDLSHIRAAMLPQLLPLLRLGGQEEVTRAPRRPISREGLARNRSFNYVTRQQAEPPVVVLWPPFPVASRDGAIAVRRERLANGRGVPRAGVGPVLEERTLDRLLEAALGDSHVPTAPFAEARTARDRRRAALLAPRTVLAETVTTFPSR